VIPSFQISYSFNLHHPIVVVTCVVFQSTRPAPLKAAAPSNMPTMRVTRDVSKPVSGWLKAAAPKNMKDMSVTRDVSNPVSDWLKATARRNMRRMVVTLLVDQRPESH